ncbi:MAG: efflux RND transporter periplasmic adaptor subunit [Bacteroidales bacterium]|nr:efflux RND transporter periplasmic adaptor subunit [Bacteroidales bacterium]
MKKILIITGIVLAIGALVTFNKLTSKNKVSNTFTEVKNGIFEITVTNTGELIAEKSLDIKGPEIGQTDNRNQGGGGGGNQNRGGGGGGGGNQGRSGGGSDMHAADLKIQDIVPEGTIVKEGDFIAQLDRSAYANTLKDERDNLTTLQTNLEMKILDTAVVLTNLRDDIKNQRYVVEEAVITLAQSKFEPPATIRQAEITLDKAKRALEQKKKGYELRVAQTLSEIRREKMRLSRGTRLVTDLEDFLAKFTITAPSSGMVIYKKERNGNKRKAGSTVNPFDRIIATLPDLSSMISRTYVNEIDISKVKLGQQVNINVDALPKKAFTGSVISIANIGEVLPNSDAKMFEVQIKVNDTDPELRPSMTTGNKIIIKTFNDAVYILTECVQAGSDSIPFVYEKNRTKQIVLLGESNEKHVIVEQGLEPGTTIYLIPPVETEKFKLVGENLIAKIKEHK